MVKIKILTFLALGLSAAVFSCNPEKVDPTAQVEAIETEETVEVKAPEISFTVSGNAEKLHNEVTLTVAGKSDDEVIEKVAFFLNDKPIGEDEEAPFEFLWNTKDKEDGAYVLKAVASNTSGKGEASREVSIKNTLFTIHVDQDYIPEMQDGEFDFWIMLSDEEGKQIGEAQQVKNGAKLIWQRPADLESEVFYYNPITYSSYIEYGGTKIKKNLTMHTYTNFSLDELYIKHEPEMESATPKSELGKVTFKVENDRDEYGMHRYSVHNYTGKSAEFSWNNLIEFTVSLRENPQPIFNTFEIMNPSDSRIVTARFFHPADIEIDKDYHFRTSEYKAMDKQILSLPFNYKDFYLSTKGQVETGGTWYDQEYFSLLDSEFQELPLFYTDYLKHYTSYIAGRVENKTFYTIHHGKLSSEFNYPDFSTTLIENGKNVQVTTRGSFDIGTTTWREIIDSQNEEFDFKRYLYFSQESGIPYAFPEIPESLLKLYPELQTELNLIGTRMLDIKKIDSYGDILKYWFTDDFSGQDLSAYSTIFQIPSNQGGRFIPSKKTLPIEEEFEKETLRARGDLKH